MTDGDHRPEKAYNRELGSQLRDARQKAGMTLRDVGDRVGITASSLSQIERGQIGPSVSTLMALVSELDVTLDHVFRPYGSANTAKPIAADGKAVDYEEPDHHVWVADASNKGLLVRHDRRSRPFLDLASGVRWELLTHRTLTGIEFMYVTYDPNSSSSPGRRAIRHQGIEFAYLVRGQLHIQVGFNEYEVNAGDSIGFDSTIPHVLQNRGSEPAEAVWLVLGRDSTWEQGTAGQAHEPTGLVPPVEDLAIAPRSTGSRGKQASSANGASTLTPVDFEPRTGLRQKPGGSRG